MCKCNHCQIAIRSCGSCLACALGCQHECPPLAPGPCRSVSDCAGWQATGKQFEMGPNFNLGDLLKLELHNAVEVCREIVDRAQKELTIEKALNKIDGVWADLALTFTPFQVGACDLKNCSGWSVCAWCKVPRLQPHPLCISPDCCWMACSGLTRSSCMRGTSKRADSWRGSVLQLSAPYRPLSVDIMCPLPLRGGSLIHAVAQHSVLCCRTLRSCRW